MKKSVHFLSDNIKIAADLYLPDNYITDKKLPAIVVSHPFGGVKEQTAGLYARKLAEQGFIALAFDAAYQGASGGEPRFLEDPFVRSENIKDAVSYLTTLPEVAADKIGALGICASGGYVPYTAQTERRIKAVATVSGADMGDLFRNGLGNTGTVKALQETLETVGKERTAEAQGKAPTLAHVVPNSPQEVPADSPTLYREGTDYYRTARAQHPNAPNWFTLSSIDRIAAYSSYALNALISPHPLLMIAGDKADTLYFSEEAIAKAQEPKELFIIKGATHIDLYDKPEYVNPAIEKMTGFFKQYLS